MTRIVIAAPYSGSGKTTLTMGILRALKARGLDVRPFKVGPDYIDTAYHARICEKPAINLDGFLLGEDGLKSIFAQYNTGDISVIEGVMGLYDGMGHTSKHSTADVAAMTSSPIVLVMDAKGIAATAAAIVHGLKTFGNADIRGVIINNISGERHYEILRKAIEGKTGVRCLGYVPKDASISIGSRHLGILPNHELLAFDEKLERIQMHIEKHVDIDGFIEIARSAKPFKYDIAIQLEKRDVKIAIAKDKAFNFYYEDNLNLFEQSGAKITYFSAVEDSCLPDCDGVYIGGGFPEVFARELSENSSMRESIAIASRSGMPIYAECGGFMYLMDTIVTKEGNSYEMCGVFSGSAFMGERLSENFGYTMSKLLCDTPIGDKGTKYRNHEFHHSRIDAQPAAYRAEKAATGKTWKGGCVKDNTFGTYAHAYFRGNLHLLQHFMAAMENYKNIKNQSSQR